MDEQVADLRCFNCGKDGYVNYLLTEGTKMKFRAESAEALVDRLVDWLDVEVCSTHPHSCKCLPCAALAEWRKARGKGEKK